MASLIMPPGAADIFAAINPSLTARGLKTETATPNSSIGGLGIVDGTVYYIGVGLFAGTSIAGAAIEVTAAGVALTLSKVGLYDSSLNRLAISADQGAAWQATGPFSASFTGAVVIPSTGLYYAAVISKGGTTPTVFRTGQAMNLIGPIGAGLAPFGRQTGQTDLPATGALSVGGTTDPVPWIGMF